jgi:integrase
MWTAMLFLGLRPGEAAGLSWRAVDFDTAVIHV